MQGCNFCAGTKEAFELISSNVKRIVTVQVMSAFVINLGRCMIVVTCTLAMFGLMEGDHFGAIFMASGVTSGLGAMATDETNSSAVRLLLVYGGDFDG